jgi:hypothetical protein
MKISSNDLSNWSLKLKASEYTIAHEMLYPPMKMKYNYTHL